MLQEREYQWIRRLDLAAEKSRALLSKWEQEFLDKLLYRFRIQKTTLHVSPNQWRVIAEIGDKIIQ